MFRKKLKSIYLNRKAKKEPFRGELFNIEQLGEYARMLAEEQSIRNGSDNNYLRERLNENEFILQEYNSEVLAAQKVQYLTPATEWLVDNFYLVEEHIQLARRHFPKSYNKELPSFTGGLYAGLPRIYGIAVEYLSHVDARIDEDSLRAFFSSYQQVAVLKIGELWAIPIMLRLILIENLRRIIARLQQDQKERDLANQWMDKIEKEEQEKSAGLIKIVSDMVKTDIPISSAFVSEFTKRLSSRNPAFGIVKNWFDQKLQDEGVTIEEVIHRETQHQTADQISVSNSIQSLRFINSTDWRDFVEEISVVEAILQTDPAQVYGTMDFASRDHYRHRIEQLAQLSNLTEEEVAHKAIDLAGPHSEETVKDARLTHVGYYLIDDGLQQLKKVVGARKTFGGSIRQVLRKYPLSFYAGSILLISLLLTWGFSSIITHTGLPVSGGRLLVLDICFLFLVSQFALFLVNHIATLIVSPDFLPRIDFKDGLPPEDRSVVVIPTMIASCEGIDKLLSDLEIHYLSNRDPELYFALLTDFTDAKTEAEEQDAALIEYISEGIRTLNSKYNRGENSLFFLFHRPRLWNPEEQHWIGYERKRGKLMAFNNFLTTGNPDGFLLTEGNLSVLQNIRYVVTLDADTQLSPCSIHKLVGTMAHTLNRPVINPSRNIVVKGYGILQPRVSINLRSSHASTFAHLFAGETGIDPYTRAISNVYQDVFHEGSFVGKGIYDVQVFEKVLADRFPENRILSHDLLESTYVRSGLVGDIELYESYPSAYLADTRRRHRWMRGDWQILPWLFSRVPSRTGTQSNPLSGVSKWKIGDNLRRALVSPLSLLLLLFLFIWYPGQAWIGLVAFVTVQFLPFLVTFPVAFFQKSKDEPWIVHWREVFRKAFQQIQQTLFQIAVFPHDAYLCLDATFRSLWRMWVSHKHLLQWQTAEDAGRTLVNTLSGTYLQMWFSPVFAILILFLGWNYPDTMFYTVPLALLWLVTPGIVWWMSCPVHRKSAHLSDEQQLFLRKIARKTWYFFETFVNEGENWLPPDNYQEVPQPVVAARTSPTNIGLSLLANLSAYDMGYLSLQGVIDRTGKTFLTLNQLKKYRGHFYNWYDTRTLEALYPLYISTVDSGNLAGHLITLAQGLRELVAKEPCNPVMFEGFLDTVRIMQELDPLNISLKELEQKLLQALPATETDAITFLYSFREQIGKIVSRISPDEDVLAGWGDILLDNCEDHLSDLTASAEEIAEQKKQLQVLALQAEQLAQMDFRFLYNEKKDLFTIGYNVMEQRYDASSYDMFASEVRLSSYMAIAQGQVSIEHWFSLSRLVVLLKGKPVLLSWSGSMFEYLMPLLVMPSFEETLLDTTYKGVVEEQIEYGKKYGIPWGVSESGYNRPDPQFNYQYQAFGIPSLGLKRGLSKDRVVAPYATLLALMVDPLEACRNMQRLSQEGYEGGFGYYEAIDYTPSHQPINEKRVTICSFMAHHQGMSLLSLTNLLKGYDMQRRFMESPQMKAFELLLQEKVPHHITNDVITDNSKLEMENLHTFHSNNVPVERIYKEVNLTPEVNLLSNGRYQLMLNSAGAGYSRWNNLAVTRWRPDPTSDANGLFIYIRDLQTKRYWSVGYQPVLQPIKEYEVNFTQAYAEYHQRNSGLDITTSVCVSPEDDVELRCVHITNHTHKTRTIELTTYSEVVIAPQGADEAHPVFSNLFVQTHYDPDIQTLFCTRRARSEEERPPWLFHLMPLEHVEDSSITFETDRSRFVGRGNTLSYPRAMVSEEPLGETEGAVLDPAISLRRTVAIPPGKTIRACIVLGMAETEQNAIDLAEKYRNVRMTDRAFELAWTHSQVVLYNLNIREAEAQLFQRLAGALVYLNPSQRAEPAVLKNNRKGQNGLWAYGISGDVPLVLVRISQHAGTDLLKQMVLAHAYWRMKGLVVEMLILNEDVSVYRQPLHDEIINLVRSGTEASQLDKPGGIMVRPLDQIPGEDRILLESAAKAIFSDKKGTLAEQLNRRKIYTPPVADMVPSSDSQQTAEESLPARDLVFRNGYGGFTRDGKEYIITLYPGMNTPAPWSNVLANPLFGTVISESGGSYTWYENAHEFRLTPWQNDPVKDTSGEAIYIRDEESGRYWSPTPLPARGETSYTVRHGFGYSVFEHTENGIVSELWVFVAMDAPVKCSVLKLKNISGRARKLSVTGYYEWVLGDSRTRNLLHITTQKDIKSGVLFARNYYNTDYSGRIAFVDIGRCRMVTGDRREFLGPEGSLASPQAMKKKRLSGKTGAGTDPCGALQTMFELIAGEEKEVHLLLGSARDETEMNNLVDRFRQQGAVKRSLEQVREYWSRTLNTVHVETPDPAVNLMANGWLLYQTLSCRVWARSGYYQSGGAYGFRDQLQDVMALTYAAPELMRHQILEAARHQFRKGDVQHWWHPPMNRGVRTQFSDDYLWLPYVTHRYVTTVKDTGVLDEMIPFLEGRELQPGEESYYDMPFVSDETVTLYEHCVRSIQYGLKFGEHGLPLMGCGDWNDGMNMIGIEGKGESVWLAFFLYDVLLKFADIATIHNDPGFAEYCRGQAQQLQENIRRQAWDGNWYRRAYFDDGTPLGSAQNSECRIDVLPQSWSVISGAGDPERSRLGMEEVNRQLVDRELNLIRLFRPAFDTFRPSPGYIQGYIPGVRENGGQYTHGVIWTAIAFAQMGEIDIAWELADMLNPIHHGDTEQRIKKYKAEPYVIAADIYTAEQHPGRGGWTWYTGSSAWMYRLLVETLLGINREGDSLRLTPRMRKEWDTYTVRYRFYDTVYKLRFHRINDQTSPRIILDGEDRGATDTLPLLNDRKEHLVEVWVK